jgi:phosphatidylglycerol:prolipoprotein diacylglycerol transferase
MSELHDHSGTANHVTQFAGFFPYLDLPGGVRLPTYFLTVSLAFCLCLFWLVRRTDRRALSRNNGLDLSLVLMVFGMIGARLFHVIFEEPAYYWESPSRIFEIWYGGFVWYGGALLGTLGFWLFLRRRHLPAGVWLDIFAPLCALGYGAGRLACVFAGCCYGRVCELPSGALVRYPTQIFAVAWELSVLLGLLWIESRRRSMGPWLKRDGQLFVLWVIGHCLGRMIMEAFRGDPRGPTLLGLSISTWLSLLVGLIAISVGLKRAGLVRFRWQARS